ncbi:MAG: hypothetical protein HFJ09_11030 [Lachnospiraceae bacterium]|nr:hypothetical protein [Lachnospiraceae bacterium]
MSLKYYESELKKKNIRLCFEENRTIFSICKEYVIARSTVFSWCGKYFKESQIKFSETPDQLLELDLLKENFELKRGLEKKQGVPHQMML